MAADTHIITRGDDASKPDLNPAMWPRMDYGGAGANKRPSRSSAWAALPWQAYGLFIAAALIVLAYGWYRRDRWCEAHWGACETQGALLAWAAPLSLLALLATLVYYVARRAHFSTEALRGDALQSGLMRDRFGNPARADLLVQLSVAEQLQVYLQSLEQSTLLEQEIAPHKRYSGINTLSEGAQSSVTTDIVAQPSEAASSDSPLAALVAPEQWLSWLLDQPHAMIAGATGTGKTTFARIALAERIRAGYAVLVADPKGKEWFGAPVVGGGRKFDEILAALDGVRTEMDRRFAAYGAGERVFDPLVVLVDEVPDIMDACLDDRRRLADVRWVRFARQLGSLAREVRISVVLMTQSPLVEDIGMNSAMRKNFSRIALGDETPLLIREERDPKRRAVLVDLLRGQRYPAALYRHGEVHLLDTASVPTLAARDAGPVVGWMPPEEEASRAAPSVAELLRRARARGWTREQARATLAQHGLSFANELWTDAAE